MYRGLRGVKGNRKIIENHKLYVTQFSQNRSLYIVNSEKLSEIDYFKKSLEPLKISRETLLNKTKLKFGQRAWISAYSIFFLAMTV